MNNCKAFQSMESNEKKYLQEINGSSGGHRKVSNSKNFLMKKLLAVVSKRLLLVHIYLPRVDIYKAKTLLVLRIM